MELEEYLKIIGKRIKARRAEIGMTQQELAAKAKISKSYLSQIENGKQSIRLGTVDKIITALECGLEIIQVD